MPMHNMPNRFDNFFIVLNVKFPDVKQREYWNDEGTISREEKEEVECDNNNKANDSFQWKSKEST